MSDGMSDAYGEGFLEAINQKVMVLQMMQEKQFYK
tara:strand:+ start:130 stop:234 length:105 start_codon:yes stop_codon:yes gene_type:complete